MVRQEDIWDRNFDTVFEFAKENGHLNFPRTMKDGHKFVIWLRLQKDRKRIRENQVAKLALLSRLANIEEASTSGTLAKIWDSMYSKLLDFHKDNGHMVVPKRDKQLNTWVQEQRQHAKDGTLRKERKAKLDNIGFQFQPNKSTRGCFTDDQNKHWEEMYSKLVDFHRINGHCIVPVHDPLGPWVKRHRALLKKNRIDTERKRRLDKLGFVWILRGNKSVKQTPLLKSPVKTMGHAFCTDDDHVAVVAHTVNGDRNVELGLEEDSKVVQL
jgi:hypothetical protein